MFDDIDPKEGARWWDREKDPERLLEYRLNLEDGWNPWRKLHLFACACCRRHWKHIEHAASRDLVETIERFADGAVTKRKLQAARKRVGALDNDWADESVWWAAETEEGDFHLNVMACTPSGSSDTAEAAAHVRLLREVLGNPFRPAAIDPAWLKWRERTVPALAQAAYDDRDQPSGHMKADKLAILADALEEAGCTSKDILGHLRGPGPHVRGCWVLDLLLGKE